MRVIPESRGAEGKAEGQPFADLNYRWRQLRFFSAFDVSCVTHKRCYSLVLHPVSSPTTLQENQATSTFGAYASVLTASSLPLVRRINRSGYVFIIYIKWIFYSILLLDLGHCQKAHPQRL